MRQSCQNLEGHVPLQLHLPSPAYSRAILPPMYNFLDRVISFYLLKHLCVSKR